jgi:hypothetical protein
MSKTTKRFSQLLQEEIQEPSPGGEKILSMGQKLRGLIRRIRVGAGWNLPSANVISPAEFRQQEIDLVNDKIVHLMRHYRQKLMSSRVTARAAYQVLGEVRNWAKRKYMEGNYVASSDSCDEYALESFDPFLFHTSAEDKLEDFERLYALGVIDKVEYYLLFAMYYGEPVKHAGELIEMEDFTARQTLKRARAKVQAHIDTFDEEAPPLLAPKPINDKRYRTADGIDENLLMNAIRYILGRPVNR